MIPGPILEVLMKVLQVHRWSTQLTDLKDVFIKAAYTDGETIYLVQSDDSTISLTPEGDCCAHCYVNDIDNSDALQGATVLEVEDLAGDRVDNSEYGDVTESWGHRIHTTKGICTIGMRVEHNGYYGGSLTIGDRDLPPNHLILKDIY